MKLISIDGNKIAPPAEGPSPYRFSLYGTVAYDDNGLEEIGPSEEVTSPPGFLKFAAQFLVVTDKADDSGNIVFAIQTASVKYVSKIEG